MPVPAASLDSAVDALAPRLIELSRRIHANPELRFEETQAAAWITELLEKEDVRVEGGIGDMPTAFRARAGRGEPRIVICAEYDALPEIGHACGHNLIAAGAVGAFLALARNASSLAGTVELL